MDENTPEDEISIQSVEISLWCRACSSMSVFEPIIVVEFFTNIYYQHPNQKPKVLNIKHLFL